MKHTKRIVLLLLVCGTLFSCRTFQTAIFDQYAYAKTIEIKVETSTLMQKAVQPYNKHLKEIGELGEKIQKIMLYETHRPNNDISSALWQVLTDKDKNLLVGFFKRWQAKGQLNPAFVKEAEVQIMEALDLLIQYEIKKDKTTKNALLQLIANT